MDHKIIVAGIGPGSPDYILPIAQQKIENAKILVGSKRALATFGRPDQILVIINKEIAALMAILADHLRQDDVVIMVSGDPGCYSLLPALKRFFPEACFEVIPGISSFQMAFAKIATVWQDAQLISLHGREAKEEEFAFLKYKKIAFLTDGIHTPAYIASRLLAGGWPSHTSAYLCERLSYEQEKILTLPLGEICNVSGFSHSVMVVTG